MKIVFPENIFASAIGKNVPVANLPAGIEVNPGDVYKLIDLYRAKGTCLTESESLSVINSRGDASTTTHNKEL